MLPRSKVWNRSTDIQVVTICEVLRGVGLNVETVVGRRDGVVAGFAGRCGAGVWHLVGMCVMALGGLGCGRWEGKV